MGGDAGGRDRRRDGVRDVARPPDPVRLSRRMSLVLRHDPGSVGLAPDGAGWVGVEDLLAGLRRAGLAVTRTDLEEVVRGSDKQRFAFDVTGRRIRAQQGHSIVVDLGLEPLRPPPDLWHGTVARALESILREGLVPGARHHVHLSPDRATARTVGARRGRPVLLHVDAAAMVGSGAVFYRSGNGVWLVDVVAPRFLRTEPEG